MAGLDPAIPLRKAMRRLSEITGTSPVMTKEYGEPLRSNHGFRFVRGAAASQGERGRLARRHLRVRAAQEIWRLEEGLERRGLEEIRRARPARPAVRGSRWRLWRRRDRNRHRDGGAR